MSAKFKTGQYVRLKADWNQGVPEEYGSVVDYDEHHDTYTVKLDEKYREDRFDDGYREVDEYQLQALGFLQLLLNLLRRVR